ncbi:MAG: leucine-rich repeat domain-containing protein [Clostridia bacterium]|nr:leucine-rich repeat domain-containing protein [Clostridia bacterium]
MKKILKLNKTALIILIVAAVVLSALAISGITYAVWTRVSEDSQNLNTPISPYNPSEKYIIYRGLDAQNNFSDITGEETVAYAAVGYKKSLVAEVVIPSEYKPSEDAEALPVVKICNSNIDDDFQYRFNGNDIITSIQIPASVTEIAASACAEMSILEKVEILGEESVTIGDYAFANCPYLNTFNCDREIVGSREKYLLGSGR